jgi:hypothetical protein
MYQRDLSQEVTAHRDGKHAINKPSRSKLACEIHTIKAELEG